MAHYLINAQPIPERLEELQQRLLVGEIRALRPFGRALDVGLRGARRDPQGRATWEEEDYCQPPLKEERAGVLDHYFRKLEVCAVVPSEGWQQILHLPHLFPACADASHLDRSARGAFDWLRQQRRKET